MPSGKLLPENSGCKLPSANELALLSDTKAMGVHLREHPQALPGSADVAGPRGLGHAGSFCFHKGLSPVIQCLSTESHARTRGNDSSHQKGVATLHPRKDLQEPLKMGSHSGGERGEDTSLPLPGGTQPAPQENYPNKSLSAASTQPAPLVSEPWRPRKRTGQSE